MIGEIRTEGGSERRPEGRKVMSRVSRYPLAAYFVLAYVFAWAIWIPAVVLQEAAPSLVMVMFMVGTFAPTVAAILLTSFWEGKRQVKTSLYRLLEWRVGIVWYLVVLLGPPILVILVGGLSALLGGHGPDLGNLAVLVPTFLFTLVFGGPLAEELGWRGYALPRLQAGRTALTASLVLGLLWSLWHLPLFFLEGSVQSQIPIAAYLIMTVSLTVLFTWVYNNTGGSVLMALLFHGMVNTAPTTLFGQAAGEPGLIWLYVGSIGVLAAIVTAVFGSKRLSRKREGLSAVAERPLGGAQPVRTG